MNEAETRAELNNGNDMKKGWEVKKLGNLFQITSSKRVFKEDFHSPKELWNITYSKAPLTREQRVANAQKSIFYDLKPHQKEFLDFVLSKYIESGVEELDQEKLPLLLANKYLSLGDCYCGVRKPC